jgi:hypothetical protein
MCGGVTPLHASVASLLVAPQLRSVCSYTIGFGGALWPTHLPHPKCIAHTALYHEYGHKLLGSLAYNGFLDIVLIANMLATLLRALRERSSEETEPITTPKSGG